MVIIGEFLRVFLHLFILFFFIAAPLSANEFRDVKKVSLKKDEHKKLLIKYGPYERLFEFRWTLYTNDGLVVFRSYDRVVAQNILYLGHRSSSFRFELKSRDADELHVPYILVMFIDFDFEKNEAIFEIFLSDKEMKIEIEEIQNR